MTPRKLKRQKWNMISSDLEMQKGNDIRKFKKAKRE